MIAPSRRRAVFAVAILACFLGAATATALDVVVEGSDAAPNVTTFRVQNANIRLASSELGLKVSSEGRRKPWSPYEQPAYSPAFAKPGEDAVVRADAPRVAAIADSGSAARLGQAAANASATALDRVNRTFTVYTCGIPESVSDFFLPFEPGCRVRLVGCPRGDCTHWPIESGIEMEETDVKGVFSVTTDLYSPGDEFAFAVYEGTCTPWEEEYCILKGNCGTRNNCEHRYDSGLAMNFKQVSCYSPNREFENHTCAGASPLYESSCAKRIVTSGDGFVWYNRIVPDSTSVSYVWGTCDEAPADVDAVCGNNFQKPPCFSMPEVEDPPVCTPEEIAAKNAGFVDFAPNLTEPRLRQHANSFCATEGVCKNATDRDVLFLLDASASQSAAAFRDSLVPLAKRLYCAAHTTTNSRIGVMIFPGFDADTCNGAQMLVPMGRYTPAEWERRINGIRDNCCATATPTAEALMLARDILKGTNEFGLHNAIAYMISDGGPAMNFGHVDCSDAAEDRFKRLSRWTTEVLGTVPDHWTGIDGEPSEHCHYSYRYVQLYGMLHQMFSSRVIFVGVPNSDGWYPQPAQFSGGFSPNSCYVNASGQFCAMRNIGHGVLRGRTHSSKSHNPDIVNREPTGLRVGWGVARENCVFHNPTLYSFISKPTYANYHNIARWTDPNIHVRPFEMMCDPNPCIDETLENATEAIKLCVGDDVYRGRKHFGNTDRCVRDRVVDACRARFGVPAAGGADRADVGAGSVSGSGAGRRFRMAFTCQQADDAVNFRNLGTANVECADLQPCGVTWS